MSKFNGDILMDKKSINGHDSMPVSELSNAFVGFHDQSVFRKMIISASGMFRRELLLLASRKRMMPSPVPSFPRWTPAVTSQQIYMSEKPLKQGTGPFTDNITSDNMNPNPVETPVETDDMLTVSLLKELLNRLVDNEDLDIEITVNTKSREDKTKVQMNDLLQCKNMEEMKELLTPNPATHSQTEPVYTSYSESSVQAVPLLVDSTVQTSLVLMSVDTQTESVTASIASQSELATATIATQSELATATIATQIELATVSIVTQKDLIVDSSTTQTEFSCQSSTTQTSVPVQTSDSTQTSVLCLPSATTQISVPEQPSATTQTSVLQQLSAKTQTVPRLPSATTQTSVLPHPTATTQTGSNHRSELTQTTVALSEQPKEMMDKNETKELKPFQPNKELCYISQPFNIGNNSQRKPGYKSCPYNILLKWLPTQETRMDKPEGGITQKESIDIKGLVYVDSEGYFSLDHAIMMDMFGYDPRESPFEPCGYAPRYDLPEDLSGIEIPSVRSKDITFEKNPDESYKEIGRGSYGVVYVGTLSTTNTRIVVKDFINDGVCWELVEHEAQILTMMQDINITPAFHGVITSTIDPQDYSLVQDHYGTGTVESILEGQYDLPSKSWLKICLHISQALYKIHNSHVLFNDLKADNILVDLKDLGIRFIDFGLATFRQGLQLSGDPEDQAAYTFLAPEVRENCESTPQSDIYSLGFLFGNIVQLAEVSELNPLFLACTRTRAKSRPSLVEVVEWLEERLTS